ncbi:hypothetical protein KG088_03320 [Halomonas sp. TRM85114]|uniref:hypothetical protein n=1 Tax=Halomonas jincaotanensis TaxID=2810616 RepID=UPI001BD5EE4F|nr:hypothetical protein [Halomonas jincaotanensis]MBS9402649.1 hypothetical protein [Halomonas jincaotanensis]
MEARHTPERVSLLLGLGVLMLSILPRYVAAGHQTRLTLILLALAVVGVVGLLQWWLLSTDDKSRLPRLLGRLALAMVGGLMAMGLWHLLFSDWISWQRLISHGATLGLLLYALSLWWQAGSE